MLVVVDETVANVDPDEEVAGEVVDDAGLEPGSGVDVVQPAKATAPTLSPAAYRPMARSFTP